MSGSECPSRVVIEGIRPEIDHGEFPIKRIVGDKVVVEADVFADGHDLLCAMLLHRRHDDGPWTEVPMQPLVNDRWRAEFAVTAVGRYDYTICGWVSSFLTWRHDLKKRLEADQNVAMQLTIGADLIDEAAKAADAADRALLATWSAALRAGDQSTDLRRIFDDAPLADAMLRHAPRGPLARYERELEVVVDRPRAGCSAWYELFPRSAAARPGEHGTLADVEARLPYVAAMGFDVLYLPPIHPIGRTHRKGRNNTAEGQPDDVGSPWGIGAAEGGHKSIHKPLGNLADFRRLLDSAQKFGIEVALDIAFQCSPDHPYVREHPEWFRRRPDGSIQYAENPPKKYQDIYPFDFESDDWRALWQELLSVFQFWIDQGVRIFRVDNPHTKPFAFWQWVIGEIRRDHPDVLFLAEAFTRPKIVYRLAKLGFTQSYTYFAWRNTKEDLTQYLTQLATSGVREYFRPNFWPNTPDILTEYLQTGGRPAFMARLVLAATMSPNYGIYGPPFEHAWSKPREPGSEEYLFSEKYEVHHHDLDRPDSLKDFIARINRIRRESSALKRLEGIEFQSVDNAELIAYTKSAADGSETLLVVVNLDPHRVQSGWVELPLAKLQLEEEHPFQVHDLIGDARYLWHGARNYVELNPQQSSAHIFRIQRRVRREQDFEYYM